MTDALMIAMDRAGAAIRRSSSSWRTTILAMLGIFGGGREPSPMQGFMTRYAERNPIIWVGYQLGTVGNGLYMMGVKLIAAISAGLASVMIALINCLAPFSETAFCFSALAKQGYATLPGRRFFTHKRLTTTRAGAIARSLISAIEGLTAVSALTRFWRIAMRPAGFRAIPGCLSAVCLDLIGCTASLTYLCNLSVLHAMHYNTISPAYCAVAIQRWVDKTGGEPVLLD
jgi:hypothetical protein